MVTVMRELQRRRQRSNVFAGRHGFITPRDLFRWVLEIWLVCVCAVTVRGHI
jgi:midasin (ATPase involved in ribosome maturation)